MLLFFRARRHIVILPVSHTGDSPLNGSVYGNMLCAIRQRGCFWLLTPNFAVHTSEVRSERRCLIQAAGSPCQNDYLNHAVMQYAAITRKYLQIGYKLVLPLLGRVALVWQRPIVVKLSRGRSVYLSVRTYVHRSVCPVSSALWQNGGSDPDAVSVLLGANWGAAL